MGFGDVSGRHEARCCGHLVMQEVQTPSSRRSLGVFHNCSCVRAIGNPETEGDQGAVGTFSNYSCLAGSEIKAPSFKITIFFLFLFQFSGDKERKVCFYNFCDSVTCPGAFSNL